VDEEGDGDTIEKDIKYEVFKELNGHFREGATIFY
jgi:hypothetical protein